MFAFTQGAFKFWAVAVAPEKIQRQYLFNTQGFSYTIKGFAENKEGFYNFYQL